MKPTPTRLLTALLFSVAASFGQTVAGALTVQSGGSVRLDNRPYQGFGVNYFDGFNRVLMNSTDTSYEAGFEALGGWGVPFVRVDFSGYRPIYTALFFTDRAEYFRRLDAFVASAEQNGIGLIPSFFWTTFGMSDVAGEHLDQLAVTNSLTRQKMRIFTTEIVNRYKNSRAIWAWEFGNEWNLAVDLPNATNFLPPTNAVWGNPPVRDPVRDVLSTDIILPAMQEFADLVKSLDPGRPISTGHAIPRVCAWNLDQWRRGLQSVGLAWTTDTDAQAREIVLRHCPAPFDLLSIHVYSISEDAPRVANYAQIAAESGKALFAGEFGVDTSKSQDPQSDYNQLLNACRVAPLVALWAYDRAGDANPNSPRIASDPGFGNTSKVVSNAPATNAPAVATKPVALGLGAFITGILSFDILRAGTGTTLEGFGLGGGSSGVSFQNLGNQFYFRPALAQGTQTKLTLFDGSSFAISQNNWYKLTASLDFSANTVTAVFVQNLTDNTAPQQLYFGAGNAAFSYTLDESRWDRVQVRSGLSNHPVVCLDNIRFETQSSGGPLTEVFADNFETTTPGSLSGQGDWVAGLSNDPWYASKTVRTWMLHALLPSTFSAWSRGWGPSDMPGGNGVTAFGQYAFGAPAPGASAGSAKVAVDGSALNYEAIVRTNDPSLTLFGETSTTLMPASWTTNGVSVVISPNQTGILPGCARVLFPVPMAPETNKFFRLRITSP